MGEECVGRAIMEKDFQAYLKLSIWRDKILRGKPRARRKKSLRKAFLRRGPGSEMRFYKISMAAAVC